MPIPAKELLKRKAAAETPKAEKVAYVKAAGNTRDHDCHGQMPGCLGKCKPAYWGCGPCWAKLPKPLKDRIWAAYRPGQEATMTPSREYVRIAREVQTWIKERYPPPADPAPEWVERGNAHVTKLGLKLGDPCPGCGESIPCHCDVCYDCGKHYGYEPNAHTRHVLKCPARSCKACGGTMKNSKGRPCHACVTNGRVK